MTGYLFVAVGGAVGAPVRYLVDRALARRTRTALPWGTVTVNIVGSLLLGLLVGAAVPADLALLVGTGFCGALTTWSTLAVQTVELWQSRRRIAAAATVTGTIALGLAAALAGYALGALLR